MICILAIVKPSQIFADGLKTFDIEFLIHCKFSKGYINVHLDLSHDIHRVVQWYHSVNISIVFYT